MMKNKALPNGIVLKDYKIVERISHGGFSFVYLGTDLRNGKSVAIKEFIPNSKKGDLLSFRTKGLEIELVNEKQEKVFKRGLNQFEKEIALISKLKHRNIINILDHFSLNGTAYLITDYEYGMTLFKYASQIHRSGRRIPDVYLIKIIIGILEAINELHKNDIIHLDIKSGNIWLRPEKEIIILDFGTSIIKSDTQKLEYILTDGYAPPEQYSVPSKSLNVSETNLIARIGYWTDYYAVGVTIYYLLTGKVPPKSVILEEQGIKINTSEEYNGIYHYKILELCDKLCQFDIAKRQTVNIQKFIQELKNIIPFDYHPYTIENILNFNESSFINKIIM